MKRMWIAIGLVAAVIATCCYCLFTLSKLKDEFLLELDGLYSLNAADDNEKTAEAAKELTDLWLQKLHIF